MLIKFVKYLPGSNRRDVCHLHRVGSHFTYHKDHQYHARNHRMR